MRAFILRVLRSMIYYLEPPLDEKFFNRTETLVRAAEEKGGSGEFKRSVVYSRLIKEFPDKTRREISLMIENVLNLVL